MDLVGLRFSYVFCCKLIATVFLLISKNQIIILFILYNLFYCLFFFVRLLNKLGGDLLGSVQTKVQRTLKQVQSSFPYELQLQCIFR